MNRPKMFLIESVKSHRDIRNPVEVIPQWRDPCVHPFQPDSLIPSTRYQTELVTGDTWKLPGGTPVTVGITKQAKEQLGPLYELHRDFLNVTAYSRGQVVALELSVAYYRDQGKKLESLGFWGRFKLLIFGWRMEVRG